MFEYLPGPRLRFAVGIHNPMEAAAGPRHIFKIQASAVTANAAPGWRTVHLAQIISEFTNGSRRPPMFRCRSAMSCTASPNENTSEDSRPLCMTACSPAGHRHRRVTSFMAPAAAVSCRNRLEPIKALTYSIAQVPVQCEYSRHRRGNSGSVLIRSFFMISAVWTCKFRKAASYTSSVVATHQS